MTKVTLSYMILGKTGEGKSATGNTILQRRHFNVSAASKSETKEVSDGYVEFGQYTLHVVDTPGLMDTDMDDVTDKETAAENMNQAIDKCYGGVDAFLFLIKFGNRFTEEDRSALQALKAILGDGFMKHVIVVMTAGDNFPGAMKDEGRSITFHEWCKEQDGALRQLYNDCKNRFVLFNNRETDEKRNKAQIQQIVNLSQNLVKPHCRYTSKCFDDAKIKREKLILEKRAPQLKAEMQEKIGLLTASIEVLQKNPSEYEKVNIRKAITDLRAEITKIDKGYGVLDDMLKLVDLVEVNMNDVEQLYVLVEQLEEIRESRQIANALASTNERLCIALAAVSPFAGLALGALSHGVNVYTQSKIESNEKNIERKIADKNAKIINDRLKTKK